MSRRHVAALVAGGLLVGTFATGALPGTAGAAPVCDPAPPVGAPSFAALGRYSILPAAPSGETAAEIVAYEANTLYVTNIAKIDIVDVTNPAMPMKSGEIVLPGDPTSVAVKDGLLAVSVPAPVKTDPGRVLFFRGAMQVGAVTVGALPDMVTFTPDGKLLAVANEGEPNSYNQPNSVDPEGSVSVINTQPFRTNGALRRAGSPQPVTTIDFRAFNVGGSRAAELDPQVRVFGPGASVAQDLEPEYITVADDGRTAWVSLQENNALARLDLRSGSVVAILPLGYSDHSQAGFGIDASDQDRAINIANWPVKGMYMPDGIANYTVDGERLVLTANEGDARDWLGISTTGNLSEEARRAGSVADSVLFPDSQDNLKLGRLNVTPFAPATANPADAVLRPGKLTSLYSFGTRSFSIRTASGAMVWDSGDQLECLIAALRPLNFNASNSNNTFDNRSDDKGPEPENVVVGEVEGRQLAFVGLERIGGVVVFDVSDPVAPTFVQYLATRQFLGTTIGPDSGPEGLVFVPGSASPTGKPMLAVGNEVTGTVNLWGLS